VLEPQFAHVRALVAYVSHYEKFARYRRFSRPLSRHESIAGSAAARLLHAALIERTSARAVPPPLQQGSATSVGSIAAASDPYAVLPASILEAVRVRARGWWRFAGRCVCSDIRRKAGPAAVSVADFTLKTALRDRYVGIVAGGLSTVAPQYARIPLMQTHFCRYKAAWPLLWGGALIVPPLELPGFSVISVSTQTELMLSETAVQSEAPLPQQQTPRKPTIAAWFGRTPRTPKRGLGASFDAPHTPQLPTAAPVQTPAVATVTAPPDKTSPAPRVDAPVQWVADVTSVSLPAHRAVLSSLNSQIQPQPALSSPEAAAAAISNASPVASPGGTAEQSRVLKLTAASPFIHEPHLQHPSTFGSPIGGAARLTTSVLAPSRLLVSIRLLERTLDASAIMQLRVEVSSHTQYRLECNATYPHSSCRPRLN
jgi:hypothetical protein